MTKRKIVDIMMSVLLLFLMAYQVTGEVLHEWIGIFMTLLVVIHQILNIRWYGALLKGKYGSYRIISTVVTVLLLCSFFMTALCGMSMSAHVVPFLYGILKISFARVMHLALSHWAFVLMGLHIGLHAPAMLSSFSEKAKRIIICCCGITAVIGSYLFVKSGIIEYMSFRAVFASLDYDSPAWSVILKNMAMLMTWVFIGFLLACFCRRKRSGNSVK